jgi:iron-sulfur cluster assembly accessory protein
MTIAEIFELYPEHVSELSEIMLGYGLHCVGCGANQFETLKQGTLGHGMPQDEFENLVKDLNSIVSVKKEQAGDFVLSERAVIKLKDLMQKEKKTDHGLQVKVLKGGCAGHSYDLSFEKQPSEGTVVIEQDGIKLFIDSASLEKLRGTELDYIETLQDSGFKFNNPNVKSTCGCGSSFS